MSNSTYANGKVCSKSPVVVNLALLVLSLLFALLVGEVAARLIVSAWPFQSDIEPMSFLTEKDVNLRWRNSPQDGRNSLGLRNREIVDKDNNVFRMMFLGDSLVWTSETSSGKLYTEVLEDNLNRDLGGEGAIEVINAGIPGYTTYQEMEFLNVYGLDMKPDMVVLGFVFNDVYYKYLHRPTKEKIFSPDPELHLNRFNTQELPGSIFGKSYLAHAVAYAFQRLYNKSTSSPYYSFEHREDFYLAWKEYGWRNTEMLIEKMQKKLSDRGVPLLMAIFPVSDQVDDEYLARDRDYVLYPQSRIKKIADKLGIPYMDLTEALYQGGGKKLFSDYLHLRVEGNDIVAHELTKYLSLKIPSYINARQPAAKPIENQ